MRMGVRDYLDKNQDFDRATFLAAVRRQLDRIGPAKRERRLHRELAAFRAAVEKVLPLVQSAAALNDPVPLPQAIRDLFRFLLRTTNARDGVLVVHSYDAGRQPAEICRVYDATGQPITGEFVPFARSVAGSVVSLQEPCAMQRLDTLAVSGTVELQPFERGRHSVLAAPLPVDPNLQVVLELFDKEGPQGEIDPAGFNVADHRGLDAASEFGTELLRQALAERQTQRILLDAVAAALAASDSVTETLHGPAGAHPEEPAPPAVLDRLREGLRMAVGAAAPADETLRLAEAIRVLALRHGPPAVRHCTRLVEDLRALLDAITQDKC
jgi:hypothetical protein